MHILKCAGLALALATAPLAGCTTISGALGSLTTAQPTDINTLGKAYLAATLVNTGSDTAITTFHLTKDATDHLVALARGVHTALGDLQKAYDAKQSLNFAAFQAALDAYKTYAASLGVPT
jgi:hypothetical protein